MTPAVIVATIIAGGGAAVARYLVSLWVSRGRSPDGPAGFPWAVLVVNVVGSGLGGVVLALAEQSSVSPELQLVLLSGVCGGLTTFSTFSVETIQLVLSGQWMRAGWNVAANLTLGFAACVLGFVACGGMAFG